MCYEHRVHNVVYTFEGRHHSEVYIFILFDKDLISLKNIGSKLDFSCILIESDLIIFFFLGKYYNAIVKINVTI